MPTSDGRDEPMGPDETGPHDESVPHDDVPTSDDVTAGFEREAAIVRSLGDNPVELVDAPDDLWARIAAEADLPATAAIPDAAATEGPVDAGAAGAAGAGAGGVAEPIDLARHRDARRPILISAAAAVIVALVVGVGVIALNDSDSGPTELAAAELTPYEGAPVGAAGGRVQLVSDGDQQKLQVDMHDLPAPAPGTFYELWLLDPDTGEPVSVATMRDGSRDVTTTIPVPEGTDTTRYDVVDVSVQEDSAGPEHSGNSVLRGALNA